MGSIRALLVIIFCCFSVVLSEPDGPIVVSDDAFDINVQDESGMGAGKDLEFAERERFSVKKKREDVVNLVEEVVAFIKKNSLNETFDLINHKKTFWRGELRPFVYNTEAVCLAHGEDFSMVWRDMSKEKDIFGDLFVKTMLKRAEEGGGWHTYQWRGAAKASYVKMVEKDGQSFMIGVGFYPHSKEDLVVGLLKGAVSFFNYSIARDVRPVEIFSQFNYQLGEFILGDLYIYAVTKDVVMIANGNTPVDAGQSFYDVKDDNGVFFLRNMVQTMKDVPVGEGRWFEYSWLNAPMKTYMEHVVDSKGNSYFIACGYSPTADREQAVELVKKGYQFMKAHGRTAIVDLVNDQTQKLFKFGPLSLFIYDFTGTPIAYGSNTALVGKSLIDLTDQTGRYIVREIIEKAKDEGAGWLDFKLRKSFFSIYIEVVDLGSEKFIIGTGVYPITKESTMVLMVKSAKGYLRSRSEEEVFKSFVDPKGNFIRGDLSIFVYDTNGICYVHGDKYDLIWKDRLNEKDDDGKLFVRAMLAAAKMGPAKIMYKEYGIRKVAYIESLQKGDKTFVFGSAFYP